MDLIANNNQTSPSKRYEWIDNARVIAALLIMFTHIPFYLHLNHPLDNMELFGLLTQSTYNGRVPLFFIFAGYFLARNISQKKAWNRFIWLFIPYAFWNFFVYLLYHTGVVTRIQDPANFTILGIGSIFIEQINLSLPTLQCPIIGPSWFLRDIMLLTLVTPYLVKFRKYIPPLLILFVSISALNNMQPVLAITISIGSCLFYSLGVCLSCFKIEDAYRIFTPKFTPCLILGILSGLFLSFKNSLIHGTSWFSTAWSPVLVGSLFGAMMIAYCGILIERHLPRISARISKLAPACFLTFMLHMFIYDIIVPFLPPRLSIAYGDY